MRFGHNFHRYQVPEWADSYVAYSSLKKLYSQAIRKADNDQPDFDGLYIALEQSINSVADFYQERHAMLSVTEAVVSQRSELCAVMGTNELESLVRQLRSLQEDFNRLQWYFRVNYEALIRICGKIERWPVRDSQRHQGCKLILSKLAESCDGLVPSFVQRSDTLMAGVSHFRGGTTESSDTSKRSCLKASIDRLSSSFILSEDSVSLSSCLLHDRAEDLSKILEKGLSGNNVSAELAFGNLLNHLAYLSTICSSRQCCQFLLLDAMPKHAVKPSHYLLSHMISSVDQHRHVTEPSDLIYVPTTRDTMDRISLHYAAICGLPDICQEILASWETSKEDDLSSPILAKEFQQCTPLHYAVIKNHSAVVRTLLDNLYSTTHATGVLLYQELLFTLFSIAVRYGFDSIVELLAKSQFDPKITSAQGETALYLASRTGQKSYVETLLKHGGAPSINVPEVVHGWTPLFIACMNGHEAVVKMLLQAGARQDIQDRNGWAPKEHAVLRGHLTLAGMLDAWNNSSFSGGPADIPRKPSPEGKLDSAMEKARVIVNLGVLQNGKRVEAVDLRSADDATNSKTGLSLEISVSEKRSETHMVELPFLADAVNESFVFALSNLRTASISFKVFRNIVGYPASRTLVGSALAFLQSPNGCYGENRESLVRGQTIPITEKETLDAIGAITFTFLVVKQMADPVSISMPDASVKAPGLQLVGHRGLGQNTASRSYLQLGENTVESFLTAVKHGATRVEFDAQLTRDLVPIIFHDFSLSESGTDIPVHDLTLDQFMHASNLQSPRGDPVSVLGSPHHDKYQTRHRSRSLSREYQRGIQSIHNRMRYTVDYMNKGFKPNTRGDFIQDSFATLDELLEKLPESIGFNIEVKYPRLHEAAQAGVAPIAIEINTFVDKILERVFRSETKPSRDIILSSFTPEVCIILALKQRKYPVMFITNAGKPPMTDMEMRASSLQAAVRFAKRWSLSGIVFASETLIMCPRLISYVKRSGLTCGSYGLLNNVPENAKIQAAAGIDIIMADRVGLIAKALKARDP